MKEYHVIIIDDEKPARDLIRHFITEYPQLKVISEAENGFDGCKLINELKPDLVFLDVQMPKLTGIELLDLLEAPLPFLIFSTAYDQYAVAAFEKNAIDYLLKPYDRNRFNQSIDKFLSNPVINCLDRSIQQNIQEISAALQRIPVRTGSKILVINIDQIKCICAEDDYVKLVTTKGNYLKQVTMNYLDKSLPQDRFVRIHRSYILNIEFLKQLEIYEREGYMVLTKDGELLPVSRSGAVRLKKLINLD